MAPSPELGGQPKAPDKAGTDQLLSNPATTTTEHSSLSSSSAPSSSSNSNNTNPPQTSGTKNSSSTVAAGAAAAGTAATSNTSVASGSSSSGSSNNNNSSTSLGEGAGAGPAAGAVTGTIALATTPQQDNRKIGNMEESDLKALLEEAITYKCPKDREHKSEMFKELLSFAEMEDKEQNFPFTSRAVQTKRASGRPTQGGSLQDLPEASLQEYYSDFSFTPDCGNRSAPFSQNWRRCQGGSSGATSVGPGGGDRATNPRQKRTTSSVSSRQWEGGSLPSNVNVECSFFNDVGHHHTTGTITKFKKRDGGSKSDYGTMVLTAPLITSAGAAELISAVADIAGSTGMCGGMKNTESQLIDGCGTGVGSGHTVIDMGELESEETRSLLADDALQQTLYDSGLDDFDGGGGDLYGSSTTTSGGSSTTGAAGTGCSAIKKIPRHPAASYTSHVNLEIGEPSSTVRPSSVHHVDKTVSLPLLESNRSVEITPIQHGTKYHAVKVMSSDSIKSDQSRVMMTSSNTKYIATQGIGQIMSQHKCLDENGNSVQQLNSGLGSSSSTAIVGTGLVGSGNSTSVGGIGGGKKRKPKSDRNTVLVIPEKIAGYRGKDHDIESLVCYIENKDKQKDNGNRGSGGSGSNPKNGTIVKVGSASVENGVSEEKVPKKKNEKKKEKAKLKKSNSLEELSSCSRKKQQAEDEQNTQKNHVGEQQQQIAVQKSQDAESAVTLRSGKGNKKAQNNVSSSLASSVSSASSTTSSHSSKETSVTGGKRGERRSWGTEELSYLEDSQNQNLQSVEKLEEKPTKKESRKESKDSAELMTPIFNAGKKRDSLRMSVESLSAISAGVGAETAEFHVVTKKKKMKKKSHSLFTEDPISTATVGYSNVAPNANNRRHLTASQSYNLGSSTIRNSNISGKYQTSNTFTNDRDVYMNSLTISNDVSRRKSTSSVPPSEKSDSSDADSVQSLPIEPTRKQQQPHQTGVSRQSVGVPQSYADIARIPNADRINNNLIGAVSNSSTSPLDSSSVEKWPRVQMATEEDLAQALKSPSAFPELVPESSSLQQPQQQSQPPNQQQYQQHQYVNSSVNSVSSNNVGNNNKATYSQSLLISTTKAAVEEDDSSNRLQQQQRLATAASGKLVSSVNSEHSVNSNNSNNNSSSSKLALHKSKSVDTNDIYYSNEHYPALEKTVKPAKAAPTVTANSNSLQEPKTSSTGKVSPVVNAGQFQQNALPQPTNAPMATTTVISGNPIASNVTGAKKSKKKDSLTTTTTAVTAAPTAPSISPSEVETINNARNVVAIQSSLDTINNNNPLLIENIDNVLSADFLQNNGMLSRSPNGGLNPQQPTQSTPKNSTNSTSFASSVTSNAVSSKRSKKEKMSSTISHNSVCNMNTAGLNSAATITANMNHRPAVIIMNDHNESNSSHEFTFGFDIDQELLFGDFQEDEVSMLDQQSSSQHQSYHHHQQKPSQHHTDNVPSPTSNTSAQSTDLGYSSLQQSSTSTASPTSSNSSQHKPLHHHYHNQPSQPQLESYELLHSTDPDTYRDSIEHKYHQPPPPMVPAMYTQPPPQLPPPHVLAAQQQSSRQSRPAGPSHYNLPPPVIAAHIQQQPPPALPVVAAKQDTATNTPAIMSVPPPPLPPAVVPAGIQAVQPVILPSGPPPAAAMNATATSSSCNASSAVVAGVSGSSSNDSNIHTSLNNQTLASSGGSSSSLNSCSSTSLQQEPKPQGQQAVQQLQQQQQQQQQQNTVQPQVREKIKEINLRFIAPEQLQTNHNHDKIVNFVGMAWEDVICGTNGSAKYYEGGQ
ncbi:myb-like protein U isoform X2 [Armigeres subalbatus]|uniref:myb-like protein U isoform X2 n=1 Tax=Armigeres subalbatus TaxID=124917 RepID=UPI002ED353DC